MKRLSKDSKEIVRIFLVAALALVLLFLCYKVFLTDDPTQKLSDEESRLCRLLGSMEGVGRVTVNVNDEKGEKLVVVVCDGAQDYLVRADILRAVSNATGAKTENIVVYKMSTSK